MPGKVLAIDDQPEVLELLADLLKGHGRETVGFPDGDLALRELESSGGDVDLVVLDLDLGPGRRGGMEILADLRKAHPLLPVVILTGKGTVDDAVKAMRLGATDFIEKDPKLGERIQLQMEKLDRLLSVMRDNRRLQRQNQELRERAGIPERMVGADSGLKEVVEKIQALADIPRPGSQILAGRPVCTLFAHRDTPQASLQRLRQRVASVAAELRRAAQPASRRCAGSGSATYCIR